jgi:DNA-binding Xre family transcriptional regulator
VRYVVKLFVREVAESRGLNMSQLQRRAQLPMSTIQRYWHDKGIKKGERLDSVRLVHLNAICEALDCEPGELVRRVPEG